MTPRAGWAASLPAGFTESQVATGLVGPTAMAISPDGRIFVCEQGGRLRVIKAGALLPTPFVTLTVSYSGERGLLGVALHPNFPATPYVYVYHTSTTPVIHNRVSRFTAAGDVAAAGSQTVLLDLDTLSAATNHNGGAIHFGKDGKLYVAVGDNATSANSQTLSNLLGKILRINPDGSIPADNPFYASASGVNRAIWARGLRNPFTFAVQPGTGRIFVNDVGQSAWEEINEAVAGANYGWPSCEGFCSPPNPSFRDPIFSYASTGECAVTGGDFYNPPTPQFPAAYVGDYFFLDYCAGWIRQLDPTTLVVTGFATGLSSPVDVKSAPDGSLYYLVRGGGGSLFRIRYTGSDAPSITLQPSSQTVTVGQPATFSVAASGTAPLSYQWQRNGSNVAGATSTSYTLAAAAAADNGARFRCRVTNAFGSATSNEAVLTVTSNTAPTASIDSPASGTLYSGGVTIAYAGTGTDAQDGTLPNSAFTWQVDFHHDTHTHPFVPATTGAKSGSFVIPTTGHTESNVWYRIRLTVTDSGGLTHSTYRDILPRKVTLTFATAPPGLSLTLDGQPIATPQSVSSVVGILRNLGAPSPQSAGGKTYQFVSWSDGAAINHNISTPSTNTAYTATFTEEPSLPAPWVSQDVGPVGLAGGAGYGSGIFTLEGSGSNIYNSADEFQFVHQPMSGDGQIVARVVSVEETDPAAMAGIMIRENLAPGSRHVTIVSTPSGQIFFRCRSTTGGATATTIVTGTAPQWLKLVRAGSTLRAYRSADGTSWTLTGSITLSLPDDTYVGLVVTSHNDATLCTAGIDSVTVTSLAPRTATSARTPSGTPTRTATAPPGDRYPDPDRRGGGGRDGALAP